MKSLPKSYKDLSVEKYQELFPTIQKAINEPDDDKRYELSLELCRLLGNPIDSLTIREQAKAIKQISFLKTNQYELVYKYIWIKGVLYKAENDVEKLLAGQYVSIKTIIQDGEIVPHLDKLAPLCYKRFKFKHQWNEGGVKRTKYFSFVYDSDNHNELSDWFKTASCHKALPIVFFCSMVYRHWIRNTAAYLNSQKILKVREEEINQLLSDENFINTGLGMQLSMK